MSDSERDSRPASPLPENGNGAADTEDHDAPEAPAANPDLDMDDDDNKAANDSDNDSDLSEVEDDDFADFDPQTLTIKDSDRVIIDEDIARGLKASKRKRTDDAKKPKEGKRDKKKRARRDDDEDPDGEMLDGKRTKKSKTRSGGERSEGARQRKAPTPENEDNLAPEERRRRALDRAMDAALKNPNKRRRKKDEVDLEEAFDEEIAQLKVRMEDACRKDNLARDAGVPALEKLKLLPEVVAVLNRNTVQHTIVDPDTNFLQSVKFFLEPLNDGSLPAYNIQRDLFAALARLPIEKEALLSSGIGKVVLYYTKSKRPEIGIKRIAERLMGEWSRPILKRSDDYKKRKVATAEYDHHAVQLALRQGNTQASQIALSQRQRPDAHLIEREREREAFLAQPIRSDRARMETANASYTVAPKSTFDPAKGLDPMSRPIGASGMDAFRKMTQKGGKKRS